MSMFDDLLDKVGLVAKTDPKFLANFSRMKDDKERVEKVLTLPELQDLQVTEAFTGKCETRAEEKLILGDYNSAVRAAPEGSGVLARSYMARCQKLFHSGSLDLALKDAKRALDLSLPPQDVVRLLCIAAACHEQNGASKLAEENLTSALETLRKSDLHNDIKATTAGEIIQQMKKISHKKQRNPKKEQVPNVALPEVTYGKNANFPAASSALRLCESPEKGRYMVASRDIKLGNVLIVERPYAWSLSQGVLSEHCLHCCAYVSAPLPCSNCATACFCSEECRHEAWTSYHRLECKILNHILESKELSRMAWLVYRIVGKATIIRSSDFSSITNSTEFPKPFLSDDYRTVWGQVTHSIARSPADLLKRTITALFLGTLLHYVGPGQIDVVTLSAAMLRHLQSCSCNAYQITEQIVPQGDVRQCEERELGGAVYTTISLCNHGCNPNVIRHSKGRDCIVRAVRNIKKGDEILDNYGPHFLSNPLEERQGQLNSQYFFTCSCEACCNNWPTVDKLYPSVNEYKCGNCSKSVGSTLSGIRACPHCNHKFQFNKIAKRLDHLSREYSKAVENLLQKRLNPCVKTCIEYCDVMDSVIVHPNKQFVSCQQAITLSWSLMGNVLNM